MAGDLQHPWRDEHACTTPNLTSCVDTLLTVPRTPCASMRSFSMERSLQRAPMMLKLTDTACVTGS